MKPKVEVEIPVGDINQLFKEEKQLHYCVMCGKVGEWDDNWIWYGSVWALDSGVPVLKLCSKECQELLDSARWLCIYPEMKDNRRLVDPSGIGPYRRLELNLET
jgi:hypothetical protein